VNIFNIYFFTFLICVVLCQTFIYLCSYINRIIKKIHFNFLLINNQIIICGIVRKKFEFLQFYLSVVWETDKLIKVESLGVYFWQFCTILNTFHRFLTGNHNIFNRKIAVIYLLFVALIHDFQYFLKNKKSFVLSEHIVLQIPSDVNYIS